MEIIPSINCIGLSCVQHKLVLAQSFLDEKDWIHIDVADGVFTFNKTWGDPTAFAHMRLHYKTEVHLMVENPEQRAEAWLAAGANRLILHAETLTTAKFIAIDDLAKRYHAELMISTNPETKPQAYAPYITAVRHFQILAVHPGLPGQKFLPLTLHKVKFLRVEAPHAKIEIDGGIDAETALKAKKHGIDIAVSASYLWGAKHPPLAYEKLKQL